jgi:hypothetical protein
MIELNVEDIVERLADLHAYSPGLAARRPDEEDLPEDPAPWLSIRVQYAFDQVASAEPGERAAAFDKLEGLLVQSYRYYMSRLSEADNPCISFSQASAVHAQRCPHFAVIILESRAFAGLFFVCKFTHRIFELSVKCQ